MPKQRLTTSQDQELISYISKNFDKLNTWDYEKISMYASNALKFKVNANHVRYRMVRIAEGREMPTHEPALRINVFDRIDDLEKRLYFLETELGVR